ncbi:MAG TPA: ferritin family protein, partial [Isosphaeraceae bacterium]|nr:ferritin family protein [Isosphaeraceae bacterium]
MRRPRCFHVESLEGRVVLSSTVLPGSAPAHGAAIVASQAPTQPSTGLDPQTLKNLQSAMEGEALAYAEYHAYAVAARQSGQKALASVWDTIADVEFEDHFTLEAQLSGLVQDNVSNLKTVIAAEADAITTYTQDAQQAFQAGFEDVGSTFTEIAQDEAAHHALFNEALSALENNGVVPSGPIVEPTKIVPSAPAASGQTLTNIINASNSEAFAWAQYTL